MFQGHPPFPPLLSLSSFAIADLHRETSDFTPTNLACAFFLSFFLSSFLPHLFFFFFFARPRRFSPPDVPLIARFFIRGKRPAPLVSSVEKCRRCRNRGPRSIKRRFYCRDRQEFVNRAIRAKIRTSCLSLVASCLHADCCYESITRHDF